MRKMNFLPSLSFLSLFIYSIGATGFPILNLVPLASASGEKPHQESQSPVVKVVPGGKLTIRLAVILPEGYELSEDPALLVSLDKKSLKAKRLRSKEYRYVFKARELAKTEGEETQGEDAPNELAEFALTVSRFARTGEVSVPIKLDVFFCSKEQGYCTNAQIARELKLLITREKGTPKSPTHLLEVSLTGEELGILTSSGS